MSPCPSGGGSGEEDRDAIGIPRHTGGTCLMPTHIAARAVQPAQVFHWRGESCLGIGAHDAGK